MRRLRFSSAAQFTPQAIHARRAIHADSRKDSRGSPVLLPAFLLIQHLFLYRPCGVLHELELLVREADIEAFRGVSDCLAPAHADEQAHLIELAERPGLRELREGAVMRGADLLPNGERTPETGLFILRRPRDARADMKWSTTVHV